MPKILDHGAAIDALCGCARTVSVLSYQEAIEGYIALRGITIAKIDELSEKVRVLSEAANDDQ